MTDAPINTAPGIPSSLWVETPADSPFRKANSPESIERKQWLDSLNPVLYQRPIKNYTLTVADIQPTVQEFCTPTPGGKESCLVTPYLIHELALPLVLLILLGLTGIVSLVWGWKRQRSLQNKWSVTETVEGEERLLFYLANHKRKNIESQRGQIIAYLERKGNQVFLEKSNDVEELDVNGGNVTDTKPIKITSDHIRLTYREKGRNSEVIIKIEKK